MPNSPSSPFNAWAFNDFVLWEQIYELMKLETVSYGHFVGNLGKKKKKKTD